MLIFFSFFLSSISLQAQTVSGSIAKKTIKRGTTAKGKIILDIPESIHVNSSIPENEFTIPTTVKFSGKGVKITELKYPKGTNRKFEFSETPINVYEKRAVMNFSFFVSRFFKGKEITIRAVVGYQACTIEVCYPPKKETIKLTAKVR